MGKIISAEDFAFGDKFSAMDDFLKIFANYHTKKLPDFLVKDGINVVMLDVIKVKKEKLFVPVVIRSTFVLKEINFLNERDLRICLHDENWPIMQRFELANGSIGLDYPEKALFDYLKRALDYWRSQRKIPKIIVSERVAYFATSEDFKLLINKVQVIKLSEEYKAEEVDVF